MIKVSAIPIHHHLRADEKDASYVKLPEPPPDADALPVIGTVVSPKYIDPEWTRRFLDSHTIRALSALSISSSSPPPVPVSSGAESSMSIDTKTSSDTTGAAAAAAAAAAAVEPAESGLVLAHIADK